jgi:O-antigen ligase
MRRREVLIGLLTGVTATTVLVSARLTPVFLAVMIGLWLWLRWRAADRATLAPANDALAVTLAALVAYAFASTLWAAHPGAGIGKVALLGAVAAASIATARLIAGADRETILCASEGLWLGLLVGVVYFLAEGLTGQAVKIWIINALKVAPELLQPARSYHWEGGKLVKIDVASFTRSTTPISVMIWPALMAALGAIKTPWNRRIAALLFVLALAAVFFSPQESSKVAIVVGAAAFGLAWLSRAWAHRIVAGVWVLACLAVVPAVIWVHALDLDNAPWLNKSAQHRIIIWNFTAEEVLKAPVFGIGAYMTYVLGPEMTAESTAPPDPTDRWERKFSRHAHNAYLQTWFELGAVGALLLMWTGLTILGRISRLPSSVVPFGFAAFSTAAALLGSSFGIWQTWYIALFGLATILFAVGASAYASRGADAAAAGERLAPRPV